LVWALVFVIGGVAATLGDANHVAFRVLAYPGGGQPLWVLGLMGSASCLMVSSHRLVAPRESPLPPDAVLAPGVAFFAFYFLTGPLAPYPLALTTLLAGTYLWRVRREPLAAWVSPLAAAVCGPAFEAGLSSTGAFHYLQAGDLPVPLWLPALYLHAGLAARAVARALPEAAAE
jgi:hypothetical protein